MIPLWSWRHTNHLLSYLLTYCFCDLYKL